MAKKRSKGEGTIWFDEANDRWMAQIMLPSGKRKTKSGKTQKEARDWLTEQRKALKDGVIVEDENITFGDFLTDYMEDVAVHSIRPTTHQAHSSLIRNHIQPGLGKIKLTELTPGHVQRFYTRKVKEGLSKRTVQYMHSIIHKVLDQALRWGNVVRNVSDLVDVPPPEKKPVETFTAEQLKKFLEAVEGHRLYPFYILCVATGARIGELLALHWKDVDLDRGVIRIRYTLQTVTGRGILIAEPKTEKSRRSITLPDFAVEVLEEHQRVTDGKGLLFQTKSGKPISPRNVIRHFKSVLEETGLPDVRLHAFSRHTHATLLLAAGVHPKVVQERLGHSSITLTLDIYSHVIPNLQTEAAEKVEDIFK